MNKLKKTKRLGAGVRLDNEVVCNQKKTVNQGKNDNYQLRAKLDCGEKTAGIWGFSDKCEWCQEFQGSNNGTPCMKALECHTEDNCVKYREANYNGVKDCADKPQYFAPDLQ